jgi:hypothetical protein
VVTGYSAPLRDRIAVRICNAVLRVLATEHYRKMVAGSIRYGLTAAAMITPEQDAAWREMVRLGDEIQGER